MLSDFFNTLFIEHYRSWIVVHINLFSNYLTRPIIILKIVVISKPNFETFLNTDKAHCTFLTLYSQCKRKMLSSSINGTHNKAVFQWRVHHRSRDYNVNTNSCKDL